MKEPVDHILRPRLPWRPADEPGITECGYDASKVKTLARDEFDKRAKELGQQRMSLLTCMTCMQTTARWLSWDEDPRKALGREIEWESAWRAERGHRLRDELVAVAALVAAHPDEFAKLLADHRAREEWLARKEPAKPKRRRRAIWE